MTPFLALVALAFPHPEWGPPPPVAPYGMAPLPKTWVRVPMVFPLIGPSRYARSYGRKQKGFLHTGIDIAAPKMTPIVAPFGGTIGFKRESFWIYAESGWAVLGTHLNDDLPGRRDHRASKDFMFAPDLVPGERVRAGQLIGYVGESGVATGPHLHFELYAPGTGSTMSRIRNPVPSLKFAQKLSAPVPMILTGKPPKGTIRLQGCVRYLDAASGKLILILTSKQLPNGRTVRVSRPRYIRLRLGQGKGEALEGVPGTTPVGVLVPAVAKVDNARVSHVFPPPPVEPSGVG